MRLGAFHLLEILICLFPAPAAFAEKEVRDLGGGFTFDESNVYFENKIVKNADAKTIGSVLECPSAKFTGGYVKDARRVFWGAMGAVAPVVGADPKSFEAMESPQHWCGYAKDRRAIYWNGTKVADADPKSFRNLSKLGPYGGDSKHVFYGGKLLQGADPKSFSVLEEIGADFSTGVHYSRDTHSVFYDNERIPGADPGSFERDEGMTGDGRYIEAKDKKRRYSLGKEIVEKVPAKGK